MVEDVECFDCLCLKTNHLLSMKVGKTFYHTADVKSCLWSLECTCLPKKTESMFISNKLYVLYGPASGFG